MDCSDNNITVEKVVRPPQKPGNKKCRTASFPRRSAKTKKKAAAATPSKLAISVPARFSSKDVASDHRSNEPTIPPSATQRAAFRMA